MRQLTILAAALLAAVAAPVVALAAQPTTAADFNLFVFGNQLTHGSDVEGAVAIGGTAHFDSFSIADKLPASTNYNLVVGGALDLADGTIYGKAISGGAYTGPGYHNVTANTPVANLPVDFAAEKTRLYGLSDYYSTLATTVQSDPMKPAVTLENSGQRYIFNAYATGLNVINISGAALMGVNETRINLGAGSTLLINVDGLEDLIHGGVFLNNSQLVNGHIAGAENILWNFSDATKLTMYDIGMIGSVLAPHADVYARSVMDGQLVANGFYQYQGNTMQINWTGASNPLLAGSAPEPASWALMIGGFGLAGVALRRRRVAAAI